MTSAVDVVPLGMAIPEDFLLDGILMTMTAVEDSLPDTTTATAATAITALATTVATTVPLAVSTATPAAKIVTAVALRATTATAAVVAMTVALLANLTDTATATAATLVVALPLLTLLLVDPRVVAGPTVVVEDMMMTAVVDTAEDRWFISVLLTT